MVILSTYIDQRFSKLSTLKTMMSTEFWIVYWSTAPLVFLHSCCQLMGAVTPKVTRKVISSHWVMVILSTYIDQRFSKLSTLKTMMSTEFWIGYWSTAPLVFSHTCCQLMGAVTPKVTRKVISRPLSYGHFKHIHRPTVFEAINFEDYDVDRILNTLLVNGFPSFLTLMLPIDGCSYTQSYEKSYI